MKKRLVTMLTMMILIGLGIISNEVSASAESTSAKGYFDLFSENNPNVAQNQTFKDWHRNTYWTQGVCIDNTTNDMYSFRVKRTEQGVIAQNNEIDLFRYNLTSKALTKMTIEGLPVEQKLAHANDVTIAYIDNKPCLFVATLYNGSVLKFEISGTNCKYVCRYDVKDYSVKEPSYGGGAISAISFIKRKSGYLFFAIRAGVELGIGYLPEKQNGGSIVINQKLNPDFKHTTINGKKIPGINSYTSQGLYFSNNKAFIIRTKYFADEKVCKNYIFVFDLDFCYYSVPQDGYGCDYGEVEGNSKLSFAYQSSTYAEMEACAVDKNGKMYSLVEIPTKNENTNGPHVLYHKRKENGKTYRYKDPKIKPLK